MAPAGRPPVIPRRAERSTAPLSFAQRGLWFIDQWAPGTARYNVPIAVEIHGRLDIDALGRAVARVVHRHEVLRATFVDYGGEPMQRISDVSSVRLRLVDASSIHADARDRFVHRQLRRDVWQPFDLATGPLLRVTLFRTAPAVHILTTSLHHIVADAPSLQLLLREVTTIYSALVANQQSNPETLLPALPIQYGDYAAWERARADEPGPALERSLAYWEQQLTGAVPLDLLTDRPRPATSTFAGAAAPWRLSRDLSVRLRDLVRRERVTLFMVLVAAFAVLLRRYSGQRDVSIGSPITTRPSLETQSLVGLFLNTLVLRMKINDRATVQQLLGQARTIVLGGLAHRDVPFERIVERVQPARQDDAPLFNVMLALLPSQSGQTEMAGLRLRPVVVPEDEIRYPLTLFAREDGDEIDGVFSYSKELFESATIARMARQFEHLLGAMLNRPNASIEALSLLDDVERGEVLTRGRGASLVHPPVAGVHELFGQQAAARPEAVAVWRDGEMVSYGDVDRRANQIAHALLDLGAGRGTRVGLCLDRRPPLINALLGTLKAGACLLPLDPTYPAKRLHGIVEDARPAVLLTERRYADLWREFPADRLVYLDESVTNATIAAKPMTAPPRTITADDPVYVIYTSGSTGTPKGVIVPHAALINSCLAVVDADDLRPGDRFLHFAPLGFDVSAFQIFPALIAGAAVVLADPPSELSNDDILDICERAFLTTLDLPSGVWQQWMVDIAERRSALPPLLRAFMTGGEATPMESVRRWASMVDGSARFVSSYGPTETTVTTMWRGEARDVAGWHMPFVTLGRPLPNVRLYIADEHLRPVPAGVAGELCVAGVGLAHGYVDRADLTAERFAPDPFSDRPGARLYRTGDRVRYKLDGTLEFLGRFDQQLKIRGVRIETAEIEALLRQHDQVRACVVTVIRQPGKRELLTAYVVPGDPSPTEADLKRHLAALLPPAVVPAAFCFLPALPVTANGKVDRRALPMPTIADTGRTIVRPRTETERLLA